MQGATADVWRIDLDRVHADPDVLTDAERARAGGIGHPPTRRQFLLTRAAVREVLAGYLGCTAEAVPIVQRCASCGGPHGRPRLAGDPAQLEIGVAHSGPWAVLAVGAGTPVGVDVECGSGRVRTSAVVRRFAPEEAAAVRDAPDEAAQRAVLLRIWTRKEAWLKATGDGLARPLSSFAVSAGAPARVLWADGDDAGRWQLQDLPLPAPAVGAIALAAGAAVRIRDHRDRTP